MSYREPCGFKRAAHDSGLRRASDIDLIVVHSAEASDDVGEDRTAEGVANYFARDDVQASTQLAVDRDSCMRMLPDLVVPWGAKGANHDGLHIELCGRARWTREQWLDRPTMLERAAWKCAKWAWQYKIPRRWLTVEELRADRRGFTTHADVNAAFRGGDHWDPGKGFPRDVFMRLVRRHYAAIVKERTKEDA